MGVKGLNIYFNFVESFLPYLIQLQDVWKTLLLPFQWNTEYFDLILTG